MIRQMAFGLLGAGIGAIGTVTAWLLWPLPDPAIDWREEIRVDLAAGACFGAVYGLVPILGIEPAGVAEFLESEWPDLSCPSNDPEWNRDEVAGLIEPALEDALREYKPSMDAYKAVRFLWEDLRDIRVWSGAAPSILLDMELSFRCVPFLIRNHASRWYQQRNARFIARENEDWLIPQWERRLSRCRALLDRFQSQIEQSAEANDQMTDELAMTLALQRSPMNTFYFLRED